MNFKLPLILASSSPRRADFLEKIGLNFIIKPADINEIRQKNETPLNYVKRMALEKHQKIADIYLENFILAADTIVYLDNKIFSKPKDQEEAVKILTYLSCKAHFVATAYCFSQGNCKKPLVKTVVTKVFFKNLSQENIFEYINLENVYDKAGAYAIQSHIQTPVVAICGSYSNVVGLPMASFLQDLSVIKNS